MLTVGRSVTLTNLAGRRAGDAEPTKNEAAVNNTFRDRVRLAIEAGVATITLDRADKGNALDLDMAKGLLEAGDATLASPDVHAVVLDAAGSSFCVGGDLREFATQDFDADYIASLAGTLHEFLTALRESDLLVVTAVQGIAAGGGMGLALFGDIVLMGSSARMRVAYTAAGLSPDCGVSFQLARTLGPARAAELTLTNRIIDADEALAYGLVSRVVADDELSAEAQEIAALLAAGPQAALAASVRLLRDAHQHTWSQHLDAEASSIVEMTRLADGREGVSAFLERRPPVFGTPS